MPGPSWDGDRPSDLGRIGANAKALISEIMNNAHDWSRKPDTDTPLRWHKSLFAGCRVPVVGYVGHYRGDPTVTELVGYEVGIGSELQADGLPEKVGVWSYQLSREIPALIQRIRAGLEQLDSLLIPGERPHHEAVESIVLLAARVHAEWIRLHPFANGNGRTARVWANYVALRYSLPAFVQVKPRPEVVMYGRTAHMAMGRPPGFVGDPAPTAALFARMLNDALGPGST
ncbi:Fic family protein [Gordonia sp. NPDC003424]